MRPLKAWQKVALVIFGIFFLMFLTTALLGDDWVLWVYPGVALVGIAITLYDGPGRKERREQEEAERQAAAEAERRAALRLERQERRRRKKRND